MPCWSASDHVQSSDDDRWSGREAARRVTRQTIARVSRGHRVTTSGELRYPAALLHVVNWSE